MNTAAPPFSVLLIEDNTADVDIIRRALAQAPVVLRAVRSEEEARALLMPEAVDTAFRPDLILLDHHLERPTGIDFVREVRGHPDTHATPVVVLSGNLSPEAVERGHELGVHAFLEKPFYFDELRDLLLTTLSFWQHDRRFRQQYHAAAAPVAPEAPPRQRHYHRVLVFDDDPDILDITRLSLELYDSDIAVSTHSTALDWQQAIAHFQPDVVLLDIHFGPVSGLDLLTEIMPLHPDLPVLLFSGLTRRSHAEVGAAGIITKPFDALTLGRDIDQMLVAWREGSS
ncbi:MAG: response regulator [Bacteroidota bacterium]